MLRKLHLQCLIGDIFLNQKVSQPSFWFYQYLLAKVDPVFQLSRLPFLTHYPPRNFLSPIFLKICTNIPQDVPIIRDRIVFWNKALLKSYKALYFFGFFNSVTLYFKIYFWIFYCWKPELSWIRIRWNFWDISIGSQDISKTVFIFLTVNLHKNDDFRLFVT